MGRDYYWDAALPAINLPKRGLNIPISTITIHNSLRPVRHTTVIGFKLPSFKLYEAYKR